MKEHEMIESPKGARVSLHVKPGPTTAATAQAGRDLAMATSRLQLQHILVPTDFSDMSSKALKYAQSFAEFFGSRITVLHVIEPTVYPAEFGYTPTILDTYDASVRDKVGEQLTSLTKRIQIKADTVVREGHPYNEIVAAAKDLDVSLIIIPTHGRTGLKHMLLGSTAERVVRHAPCPVLTIRDREHDFVSA